MAITTTSMMTPAVKLSFSQRLLAVEDPDLVHKTAALRDFLPRNGGDTLRRIRYSRLGLAVVPLGNSGQNPPPQTPNKIYIDAKVDFFGTYLYVNEQVILQSQEKVLNELTIRLGVSMRQSQDQLVRDALKAAVGRIDAAGGLNGDDPTDFTFTDCTEVTKALKRSNAQTIMNNILARNLYGTGPVRQSYFCMAHTDLIATLDNIPQFKHVSQYAIQDSILPAEWGSVGNIRFLLSSVGSIDAGASLLGADVYDGFISGIEAYGCVEQDGLSAQFIYLPPQFSGGLAQNVTLGYKFGEVAQVLNDHWIVNMRSTLPAV